MKAYEEIEPMSHINPKYLGVGNNQLGEKLTLLTKSWLTFFALLWWVQLTEQYRSCTIKCYYIYSSGVFHLNNLSKDKQRNHIYHFCMLYLTDPGAPGTFQTWRPQKSLISPSSGELSPLQCCTQSEVIRGRCSFHKLIIAVYDSFSCNAGKQSLFF